MGGRLLGQRIRDGWNKEPIQIMTMRRILASRKFWLALILAGGIFFRITHFLENRSLWMDEAYVANQVLSQSWLEILGNAPFDLNMPGPPVGFLLFEKLMVAVLGNSEYALRLLALVCGLAALGLFLDLLRQSFRGPGLFVGLALFAVCESLVYYSAEMKPYGVEALLGIALPWAVVRVGKPGMPRIGILVGLGAGALLFSYAAVFVLAAAAVVLLLFGLRRPAERQSIGLVLLGWAAAFFVLYGLYWHPMSQRLHLNSAIWKGTEVLFFPWPLWTAAAWARAGQMVLRIFQDPAGMCCPWLAGGIFLLGVVRIWGRDRGLALLLILPMLVLLAASAARQYFFYGRFVLFLLPAIFFMIAAGIDALWQWPMRGSRYLALVCGLVLVLPSLLNTAGHTASGWEQEDAQTLMQQLHARYQPGDAIFVNDSGQGAFVYYYMRDFALPPGQVIAVFSDGLPSREQGGGALQYFYLGPRSGPGSKTRVQVQETPISAKSIFVSPPRSWLLFLHNRSSEAALRAHLAEYGRCLYSSEARGGSLFLYEMNRTSLRSADRDLRE